MIIIVLHAIGRRRKVTNRKGYYLPILSAKLEGGVRESSRHGRGLLVAQSHMPACSKGSSIFFSIFIRVQSSIEKRV